MKKKLLFFMMSSLVFSFVVITILLIMITNYQYEKNIRYNLDKNNKMIIQLLSKKEVGENELFSKDSFLDPSMRVTYINKDGKVLKDTFTDVETLDNHNTRQEVIEARSKGIGSSVRYSATLKKNMMYYATAFGDGYIIRSSMPMEVVNGLEGENLRYYIGAIILVFCMAIAITTKLSNVIVKPIEDLEFITFRVAHGELDRRVKNLPDDEIGHLGKTFNEMADRLQSTLNEVMDKQNRLEAILRSMDSGVIAVDKFNKVIMINPYAKNIFQIEKDIIGKNFMDSIRNFELEELFKGTKENFKEVKILWPKERDLRVRTADIVSGKDTIGKVAVVQDITDIKKLESIRSQFVANVSHELKTPLTSIKGFAETLKFVEDTATKDKFLDIINDEADRLTRLINDILILSDIENRKDKELEITEISVNQIIEDIYNLMKNTADQKSVQLKMSLKGNPLLSGNIDRFKQMLINLVDNAIKYSDKDSLVTIGTDVIENQCEIWVKDNGIGIPEADIPRLFERFYRVDKARSRAQGGTGLGLAIVKHIVLNFNGTIEVKSDLGKGSTFIVRLPIVNR